MNAFTDGEGRINLYDNEDGDVGIGDFKFQNSHLTKIMILHI